MVECGKKVSTNVRMATAIRITRAATSAIAILVGVIAVATAPSCAGGGSSASRAHAKGEGYAALYSSGQYQAAYEEASRVASSLRGTERQRAALIAGLSAQALNRNADAERWLAPLVDDADRSVAGEAGAALGLVALERKEYAKGATLLMGASERLGADDAARSAMYAGDCYRSLGDAKNAQIAYRKGEHYAKGDSNLKVMIADRLASLASAPIPTPVAASKTASAAGTKSGTQSPTNGAPAAAPAKVASRPPAKQASPRPNPAKPVPDFQKKLPSGLFAVQVGAYSTRQRALSRASDFTRFGPPRVIRTEDYRGRNVYAIRLGMFRSEAQAEKFGRWIGKSAEVVSVDDES